MSNSKEEIKYNSEFDDLLTDLDSFIKSKNNMVFCQKLDFDKNMYNFIGRPFKNNFYCIALIKVLKINKINDLPRKVKPAYYLFLQNQNVNFQFKYNMEVLGYSIFFKKELFDIFNIDLEHELSMLNLLKTNILLINLEKYTEFSIDFEGLYNEYDSDIDNFKITKLGIIKLLLKLNYHVNKIGLTNNTEKLTQQNITFNQFIKFVSSHIYEKRTVDEYSQLIGVSSNYLSKIVKLSSGKNALDIINEKLLSEAKNLLIFTNFDIATIAFKLNFSNQANFSRFFRKHLKITPFEFRKNFK